LSGQPWRKSLERASWAPIDTFGTTKTCKPVPAMSDHERCLPSPVNRCLYHVAGDLKTCAAFCKVAWTDGWTLMVQATSDMSWRYTHAAIENHVGTTASWHSPKRHALPSVLSSGVCPAPRAGTSRIEARSAVLSLPRPVTQGTFIIGCSASKFSRSKGTILRQCLGCTIYRSQF
jgi:hypothetical protein